MPHDPLHRIMPHLHRLAKPEAAARPDDAELLERWVSARDGAAFEVLLWRHGPMVLQLCRRVLRHEQDAEDAFQATFLLLARKAGAINKREAIGSWLYKVAFRAALAAKAQADRRASHEKPCVDEPADRERDSPAGVELRLLVDEEVSRLPARYRVPVVLHYFEGLSGQEVARQLGCLEATVRTRLARARERLRGRLTRRGVARSTAAIGTVLTENTAQALPGRLAKSTIQVVCLSAGGKAVEVASPAAARLAEGVSRTMLVSKLKQVAVLFLVAGALSAGLGISIREALAGKALPPNDDSPSRVAEQSKDDRTEIQGTWESHETLTSVVNGKPQLPQRVKITWVIKGDKLIRLDAEGFIEDEQTFTLDPTGQPKRIEMSDRRTGQFSGIYQLDGDRLKIAMGDQGRPPTAFPANVEEMRLLKRVSRNPAPTSQRFANAPGCFWIIPPSEGFGTQLSTLGITYFYDVQPDGAAVITMAYMPADRDFREYYPVLVDAAGKRYLPQQLQAGSSARRSGPLVTLGRWRMDPAILPAARVVRLGVEAVTAEADRLAAQEAMEKARKRDLELLPWPEAGAPYSFTLTGMDGRKIRSTHLKGKVVLIDFWATWCAPCMASQVELKALYEKRKRDGLEIIGINFDNDPEIARKSIRSLGLTWPQVRVPSDEPSRRLWEHAVGLTALPRMLLIGRDGVLQPEPSDKVEAAIGRLLKTD
jgi:RNA polymerase sigma factor (sigma-70 family)